MLDKTDQISDRLIGEVLPLLDGESGLTVSMCNPDRSFAVDKLDGNFEDSIYDLINHLAVTKGIYKEFLNLKQMKKILDLWNDGYRIPNLSDEDEYGEIPFDKDEVEHRVICATALKLKELSLDTSIFLGYFEEYGYEDMVEKLR